MTTIWQKFAHKGVILWYNVSECDCQVPFVPVTSVLYYSAICSFAQKARARVGHGRAEWRGACNRMARFRHPEDKHEIYRKVQGSTARPSLTSGRHFPPPSLPVLKLPSGRLPDGSGERWGGERDWPPSETEDATHAPSGRAEGFDALSQVPHVRLAGVLPRAFARESRLRYCSA